MSAEGTAAASAEEPENDDELMRKVAQGDRGAFARIVRSYQNRVQAFAIRMLGGDAETAGDIAQETFLRLWSVRETYQPKGQLIAYLFQIARNLCRDEYRHEMRLARLLPIGPDTAPPADARLKQIALAQMVSEALAELPEKQRVVFVLSHYEGLSYREIADIVCCPMGTVASRKALAVEALRGRMKAWIEE